MSYWDMLRHTYGDDGYDERSSDALFEKASNPENREQNEQRGEKTIKSSEVLIHDGESFEVGEGLSKEAEFKRITGEDWPGTTYYAESNGSDGGDDGVLETWIIRKRPTEENVTENQPSKPTNPEAIQSETTVPSEDDLAYQRWLKQNESRSQEQYDNEYSGGTEFSKARNINDKSGKERTYSEWDIYNRQKGETSQEFGDRAKERHEEEQKAEGRDKLLKKVQQLYYEGRLSQDEYHKRVNTIMNAVAREKETEKESEEEAEMEAEKDAAIEAEMEAEAEAEREKAEEDKAKVEDFRHKVEELIEKFDEEKTERIKSIQEKLASLRPELAELYAKNRRLFVTHKNRELFQNAQTQYNKLLNELLSLKTEQAYKKEQSEKWSRLSNDDVSKAHSDLKKGLEAFKNAHPNATKEELTAEEERLKNDITAKLLGFEKTKEKTSAAFLSEYLKQQGALEEATVDALDNGTIWRRFTHNVIDNKKVKATLAVLGAAGAAFGVAATIATGGIASIGFAGWAGVASGAGRGALSGAIMSRQDSKNSAVHRLATEEELKKQFEEIAITSKGDVNINNVASFLVGRYESANEADRSNNRKRTLISAGIGAAIGGIMGGVQLNKTITSEKAVQGEPELQVTGYTEGTAETRPAIDIDTISHARGKGTEKLFLELGGESSEKYWSSDAHRILLDIGKKYGLTEGRSGWTHPGHISEWPSAAQGMAREVAEEWARQGLIPSQTVMVGGGEPIFGLVPRITNETITEVVKDGIFNNLTQGSATVAAGAIGGLVGGLVGRNNRANQSAPNTSTVSRAETPEEDLSMDNTPDFEQNVEIPQANVENAREAISRLLGALGQNISDGDLGLIIRGNERPYSDAESAQLEALWGGLDEDARSAISEYMAYEGNGMDSRTTNSFQNWLNNRSNETVGVPVETPAEASEATSTEATPEASSTPSAEDLRRQQLSERIETFSRNLGLSDENISIMKEDVSNNSDEYQDRASAMLESLTPEQRREIFSYFRNEGDNALGSAFYSWLRLNHGDAFNTAG